MPADLTLETLRAALIARFPELAGSRFTLLTAGWDSVAVDVDDRLIFRFPRSEQAIDSMTREASLLAIVGPHLTMAVPQLEIFPEPPFFSKHAKLPGDHLVTSEYDTLPEPTRDQLAADMALLYAELHALDPARMAKAGAAHTKPWPPDDYLADALRLLPPSLHAYAREIVAGSAELPPDPPGEIYGYFDGHGWNMAFDHACQRLNGVYDFADSRIGPLHHEFIYSSLISADLTARIIRHYESLTGRTLDRRRIRLATGMLLLGELAAQRDELEPGWQEARIKAVADWQAAEKRTSW